MFHACVQRFDGMDEKFLNGELNRALYYPIEFLPYREERSINARIMAAGPSEQMDREWPVCVYSYMS